MVLMVILMNTACVGSNKPIHPVLDIRYFH